MRLKRIEQLVQLVFAINLLRREALVLRFLIGAFEFFAAIRLVDDVVRMRCPSCCDRLVVSTRARRRLRHDHSNIALDQRRLDRTDAMAQLVNARVRAARGACSRKVAASVDEIGRAHV